MRVKILGSAAGGGFPQWNCACPNCRAVRSGTFQGKARTQTQVAITQDSRTWFLLGASPDLLAQIEATPELHPRAPGRGESPRQSPIAGAILANADLDHVLGLLLLRELQPLRIYATASIRRTLREGNSMFGMLERVANQASWTDFTPGERFPLLGPGEQDSGLRCRALSLGTHFPAYVSAERQSQLNQSQPNQSQLNPQESSLGLLIDSASGKRLAYLPAVPEINDALLHELDSADLLFFDGTFWSDDELIRTQGSGRTAQQMGHVPVSSPVSSAEGSLQKLAGLHRPRKIYLHVNNTNPMLNEAGPEYRQVRAAGWEIAEDGCQFDL